MENKKLTTVKLTTSLVASLLLSTNLYSAQELSAITVTSATKSEQSIKDVTSNIEVITKEDIEDRKFTSVIEALNTISGISFYSRGNLGSSSSVYLRGMDNKRSLFLIDGVRYYDPSNTSGGNYGHLMINDIERIEVIKGAQSGIWGANAAAGVINIITKKTKKDTNANIIVEAGSFKTKKFGTSISHGADNFDVKFTANRLETDGYSSVTAYGNDPKDYEKDGYKNTTISIGANYYISDNSTISLNIKNINALVEYDSLGTPNDDSMKSDVDTTLYNIVYSHKVDKHNIKLDYQLSDFKRHEIGTVASPGFTWNGNYYAGSENVLKFNGKTHSIELSDEYKYSDNDFLLFGSGLSKDDVNFVMTDNSNKDRDSKSKYIYLTNSNKFDKIVLTQSIRYDNYTNFDNKFTGKLGIKYSFNNDLSFTSNVGTGYTVPSILEEFNPWGTANFNLEPEETKSLDIGFTYNNFSLTYFKSYVDNLIDWNNATSAYENVEGESKFKGVELSYMKTLEENTLLTFNYTHLSAKDDAGDNLLRRPKRELNLALDYYGIQNFHFNVNAEYVGNRKDASNKQTGKYTVWNSVVNYDLNKNLDLYLKVNNVFDKYYQTSYGYATAPRNAYVGLKYNF